MITVLATFFPPPRGVAISATSFSRTVPEDWPPNFSLFLEPVSFLPTAPSQPSPLLIVSSGSLAGVDFLGGGVGGPYTDFFCMNFNPLLLINL